MLLQGLKPNPALDVLHFPTLDDFRAFEPLGDSRNIPLSGRCASARAHVVLSSSQLTVQRTFPRILEATYKAVGTLCFVPLGPTIDVTVNGIDGRMDRIMALSGVAACEVVEPQSNLFAIIHLAPGIADRGWPDTMDRIQVVQATDAAALASFRTTVRDLIGFASAKPELATDTTVLRHMEQSLLSSLDDVMASPAAIPVPGHFDHYVRIVRRMEEYLAFHPSADMYGEELAQACGVSLRTLQTATRAVRGLSVHRYLRMRRLWQVRCALALGRRLKISDVARANGFWHMGEFSSAYRAAFGETPSETLARNS